MTNSAKTFDVIIVGAGPVGLFLACELKLAGIDVSVLESLEFRASPLKAAPLGIRGLSMATVETLYRRNLLNDLRSLAIPREPSKSGSSAKEKRGGHFAGIGIDFEKVDESRWFYRLPGPGSSAMSASMEHIEQVLSTRANALGVSVEYRCQVTDVKQTQHEVEVFIGDDSRKARWVVGCDGGRSQIRRVAKFDFLGTEAEFTAYIALATLSDADKLKPGRNLTPYGFYMQPFPGYISVMEFDGGAFDRSQGISREHLQSVLRRVSETDVTITDLQIATSYTDRAKATSTMRKGRIFLAGDSAHIHSPLGGQGLNVGLADALNLGWKLAATLKGSANSQLLDTYCAERQPIAEWVLAWTRAQVQLMKPDAHSKAIRSILADLMETKDGATYFAEKLWSVSLRYDLGSIHPLVGMSVPDFEFSNGSRIGSSFEDGKGIFLDFESRTDTISLRNRYADRINFMSSIPKDTLGISSLLIRPDGVVCWLADEKGDSASIIETLEKWFGQ